jgi:hypothetical protein
VSTWNDLITVFPIAGASDPLETSIDVYLMAASQEVTILSSFNFFQVMSYYHLQSAKHWTGVILQALM